MWGLWRGWYTVTEANEHAVQLAEFVLCVHWKCLSTTSCWSSGHTKLSIPQECLPKLSAVTTDDRKLACYCWTLSQFLSDLLSTAPLLFLLVTLLPVPLKKKIFFSPKNRGQVCNVSTWPGRSAVIWWFLWYGSRLLLTVLSGTCEMWNRALQDISVTQNLKSKKACKTSVGLFIIWFMLANHV